MAFFKDKYRKEHTRLKGWDYSQEGSYYITLVTKDHVTVLGNIQDNRVVLSDIGKIVDNEWKKSFEIRTELVCCEYVVMPNHLHAVVEIRDPDDEDKPLLAPHGNAAEEESTLHRKAKSISTFVSGFKAATTRLINQKMNIIEGSIWQSRFYDHIIRDEEELLNIRQYIRDNPLKWEFDEDNPERQK
jgi:putative transposase